MVTGTQVSQTTGNPVTFDLWLVCDREEGDQTPARPDTTCVLSCMTTKMAVIKQSNGHHSANGSGSLDRVRVLYFFCSFSSYVYDFV